MFSDVSHYVLYKIANAPIQRYPFPHIYVRDVFPPAFYQELREHLPPKDVFNSLKKLGRVYGEYPETRLVLPLKPHDLNAVAEPFRSFWNGVSTWLLNGTFGPLVMPAFGEFLAQRFGDVNTWQFYDEALLVQDYTTYSLGPHTDNTIKVLSFLFYLPSDDSHAHLGTSIYVPKDPNFTCEGGPHHPFEWFNRMYTMPYLPNTLFAFLKTHNSFHGVEPITDPEVRRDLLLYDIRVSSPSGPAQQPSAETPGAATPVKFSF